MDEWKTYAGRLTWAMRRAGKNNQSELARAVGITPQSIQYLCRADTGAQGSKHTAKLASELAVSAEWLARNEGLPDDGPSRAVAESTSSYLLLQENRAAVTGTVRVGEGGQVERIDLPRGESDGFVAVPLLTPPLHALRVKGNGLAPFAKDGQYLLLQRGGILYPEEGVVVTLASGRTLVREMVHRRRETLVLIPVHGGQLEAVESREVVEATPIVCVAPASLWRPEPG